MPKSIIVVRKGNAALCAAIAALEKSAQVLMLERLTQRWRAAIRNTRPVRCGLLMATRET